MKKISIFVLLIFFLLISCILLWWALSKPHIPQGIILISLDTLRADHLGSYGYQYDTSPFIDEFAKESVLFENAVVQAATTLPSHMSMMTSLYPSFHGVKKNSQRLADSHVTLAELLHKNGYNTAAFTDGALVSGLFGFNQGFDIYDDQGGGIVKILSKVKSWVEKNKSDPFFLFIHCYDIHSPYNSPPSYISQFHDFTYTGDLIPSNNTLWKAHLNQLNVNHDDIRHLMAFYDGGIRYTDEKIGEFFSFLRKLGLYDKSLIIITSDHGEEFKEHGSFLHYQLYYRPNLHVPLIMHIPSYSKRGIRIENLVRSIDIFPTVLNIAGLPDHPIAQGKSLLPLINRRKNIFKNFLWSIRHPFEKDATLSFAEFFNNSIMKDGYQMIFIQSEPGIYSTELYDLSTDPMAQRDISAEHPDITKGFLAQWQDFYSQKVIHPPTSIDMDNKTQEQLVALGYLEETESKSKNLEDYDGDGILDEKDNCPGRANVDQKDIDKDGAGDACDNCPLVQNPSQEDIDNDETGDTCDECVDQDWDGYGNPGYSKNQCLQDNCPTVFNPDQEDADGNGIGNICEPLSFEYYWWEAENADSIIFPFEVAIDENASESKYIYAANGTDNQNTSSPPMAIYSVNVLQAGDYVLWGRVLAPTGKDNSFFITIDNGLDNLWNINTGKRWHWDQVNNRDRSNRKYFRLTKGEHTIKVKLREDGTKLDKMLLTNNIVFLPNSEGH